MIMFLALFLNDRRKIFYKFIEIIMIHECEDENIYPMFLTLEDKVPDFDLEVYDPKSDEILKKQMSDYAGKWLVVFFYPADFTFVCPTELKDLNSVYGEIKENNAELLVVSVDTAFSHKRRVETEGLLKWFGINMVADRTVELSEMFGVMNPVTWNAERWTFIISPDGVIKSIEVVTEPIGRSSAELVRKLKALEFVRTNPGSACPASWDTWAKTLNPSIKIAGKVDESLNS